LNSTGEGAFYSQTPESCLEDLGVNIKYPRPLWERVPKAGEGSINKEILRPSAEVLSATSTTNAQNDRIIPLSEGRGRNCANGSERTISGEGLVKESQNQVDMLDPAFLRRYTPQNDISCYPRPLWERVPKAGEGFINKEILRQSAEILSEHSTTNAQNYILDFPLLGRGLGRGFEEENDILRSSAEILNELSMTNAQNDMVVGINIPRVVIMNLFQNLQIKQISTIQRFFGLRPQNDKGVSLCHSERSEESPTHP